MPKVKVGDINMYYEIHGEGEPLVLIPGMGANVERAFMDIPVFSRVYKVVAFDPRGAGRTDAPAIPYTIKMMADDLAGLLDVINIESAHIHGSSMGGMIAQELALHYADRVRSLILACTGFGWVHGVPANEPLQSVVKRMQSLPMEERIMERLRLNMSQEFIDNNPELIQRLVTKMMEHPASPQGQMGQMQADMSFDTYDRLPQIKAPTLVIHGEADRMIPVENARILASRIPGAELVTFKNMGHLFGFEAFEEVKPIILDFLCRHSTIIQG